MAKQRKQTMRRADKRRLGAFRELKVTQWIRTAERGCIGCVCGVLSEEVMKMGKSLGNIQELGHGSLQA